MHGRPLRILSVVAIALGLACAPATVGQQPPGPADAAESAAGAPLPDISTLLARVRSRYNELEAVRRNYIFTVTQVADEFGSNGAKKTHTDQYQAFFVNDTEVLQHVTRDGKPLSPADARKEQSRVDKQVAELKAHGRKHKDELRLSASGLLKVASFSNPRREILNGRPTLVFDYKGNPHAHADDLAQQIMRQLAGTLWVDEHDNAILRLDGTLQENFHVGGGLLVNIRKGSWFDFVQTPVNDEIWFPREFTAHVDGRLLLVKGFNGDARESFSDYRKLRTTVTILPGSHVVGSGPEVAPVEPASAPEQAPHGAKPSLK